MNIGLYVHIPFCQQKCFYCDFPSFAGKESLQGAYMAALNKEIIIQSGYAYNVVDSIFIGGGTPTLLSEKMLSDLLESLNKNFKLAQNVEISIEANPGTIDKSKLQVLFNRGVNRLSFGVQSFNDAVLKKCGRIHNENQAKRTVCEAQEVGFRNINVDLMYGLPEQTLEILKESLFQALELKVQHLSIYGLKIEEDTLFEKWISEDKLILPDDEVEDDMYELINSLLPANGFRRYEISNYCKEGFECKHNLKYWHYDNYLGLGAGAHSLIYPKRQSNIAEVEKYIKKLQEGELALNEIVTVDKSSAMEEFCFLALRTTSGININKFNGFFEADFNNIYGIKVNKLINMGLLQKNDIHIFLTSKGRKYGNVVFAEFLL